MTRAAFVLLMLCPGLATSARPVVAAAPAGPAPAAKRAAVPSADAKQAAQIEKLKKAAVGHDAVASDEALARLKALGEPGRKALLGALRQVLARDKAAVLKAGALAGAKGAEAKFADVLERVESTREAALINLGQLKRGEPVREAREHYDALVKLLPELNAACAAREPVARLMRRRAALLAAYREVAPAGDAEFDEAAEAKLTAAAERALGKPVGEAKVVPSLAERATPPEDPVLRHLWFYRACRDIEAYNATLRPEMSRGEWENLTLVNRYREALGILPFEVDPRLVQAARRHSREMNDQQYFSHESPTPGLKTYMDRMRAAGYEQGGYGENIAAGPPNAEQTFWGWFDSPGHHRNMANAASTAIGIGHWDRLWTQNMGTAPRLMLLPPDRRAEAAAIVGDVLKPRR